MYSLPFTGDFFFEYPWLLFLIPLYFVCRRWCRRSQGTMIFPHKEMLALSGRSHNPATLAQGIAWGLFVVALASPVMIDRHDPRNRIGYDIMLVVDASRSMSAFGFDPSLKNGTRLDSVKEILKPFVARRSQDNLGVVVFGDFAFLSTPPTYEKEVVMQMIDDIEIGIAGDNTAIGDGIGAAVKVLDRSKAKTKIIILLTDGMANRGMLSPIAAAQEVARKGIRLYTIGMGAKGEFDTQGLAKLALIAGGQSYQAYEAPDLKAAYESIDKLEKSTIKGRDYPIKSSLFTYPLLGGLIAWIVMLYYRRRGGA